LSNRSSRNDLTDRFASSLWTAKPLVEEAGVDLHQQLMTTVAALEAYVCSHYDWPLEFHYLTGPLAWQKSSPIEMQEWDLIIAEDLTRISRDVQKIAEFLENCRDANVRVICVNDRFDSTENA